MRFSKHHGLGNDFLVVVDAPGIQPVTAALARAACDRRRGVGADGLLWATAGVDGVDATMVLFNADGSRAEMSGNGIGCLVQAVVGAGWAPLDRVVVRTDAGIRVVAGRAGSTSRTTRMQVDMGAARVGAEQQEWLDDDVTGAVAVDMGNPHLVLRAANGAAVDLAERGRLVNERVPGGSNVEVIRSGPGDGVLTMEVYERGVGITAACGTGACAAAAAAAAWGLVGREVTVRSAGGSSDVLLGASVVLTTTVTHVADIDFHADVRADLHRDLRWP